jgi:carbon-monoxide dehydrogenase small subunit
MQVELTVNGKPVSLTIPPTTLLVQALREHLKLTGTHVGCDTAQCGACTVLLNGTMHPMQAAFKDCHGLQCGYCTPGMVLSAVDLCQHNPGATEAQIRELLEGNICRCTGYQNIVKAVQQGAAGMAG